MQRLSRSLRLLQPSLAQRTSPALHGRTQTPSFHPVTASYATKSSPKSAEKASAASGGSRSKDAIESGEDASGDPLETPDARGRTGGGPPLKSSTNAPPKPKITNASVPGEGADSLTPEQQKEVDEHNRDFEKKHDRANPAANDKVDKSFWSGGGSRDAPIEEKEKQAAEKKSKGKK